MVLRINANENLMQLKLQQKIRNAGKELGVVLREKEVEQLIHYMELLDKWNKVYNLTAVTKPNDVLAKHIFDTFAIAPHIFGESLLDVGSGAGIPGLILAIIFPELKVVLLDCNGKKCNFLQQVIIELDLKNAEVLNTRVEDEVGGRLFDVVICRAFSSLERFVTLCQKFLSPQGVLLAMKAKLGDEGEQNNVPEGFVISKLIELSVPDLDATRQLVFISKGDN